MPKNDRYIPSFKWMGNATNGYCIYDNNQLIAELHTGENSKINDNVLAYQPISLHNLKLTPVGETMIAKNEICGPLCLSWRKHLIFDMAIEELSVDDSDPQRLKMYIKARDIAMLKNQPGYMDYKPNNFKEETYLELSYDHKLRSYVYDIRTALFVSKGREEFILAHDKGGLEFGDILPAGADDYFPPKGNKRYTHIIYKSHNNRLYNRPQNKHLGPDKWNIFYAPDGFAIFGVEQIGNPTVEFLDKSGSVVYSAICWAMYDLHFKYKKHLTEKLILSGKPLTMHYRFYSTDAQTAAELFDESVADPVFDDPMVRAPVFRLNEVNEFTPSQEYERPSDEWFWLCTDPHCYWDWQIGFERSGSLSIDRNSERTEPFPYADEIKQFEFTSDGSKSSQWLFNRLDGKISYSIKVMVRTSDVVGDVFIALQYKSSNNRCYPPIISEKTLTGDNDWTEITLTSSCPDREKCSYACLFLTLAGKGKCWFDCLTITAL